MFPRRASKSKTKEKFRNSTLSRKHKSKALKASKMKVKAEKNKIQTAADTYLIKSRLIPKLEKKTNDTISVSIKQQPFHFHIPIVSGNPVELPPFTDIMATALEYKNPLTVDIPTDKKVGAHSPLAKRELDEVVQIETRIERNSPVLDFLDIDRMVMKELEEHHVHKIEDLDLTDGIKRSVQKVAPTDAVIQELVGDKDDLEVLQKRAKQTKEAAALARAIASLNRKTRLTRLDVDIDNNLKRKKRHQKGGHHHRAKRGLGKWLKSIFHRKTTTTTTTPRPRHSHRNKNAPEKDRKQEPEPSHRGGRKENERQKIQDRDRIRDDYDSPHADTAVDKLLPKYLRTSSYWERKKNAKYVHIPSSSESSSDEDEPNYYFKGKKPEKEKKKRFRRGIFDELPIYQSMNPNNDAGGSSSPHLLQSRDAMHPNLFTGNYFSQPIERFYRSVPPLPPSPVPLTSISKEEMKIVHEIFSNIINEKCYPVNSQVLEVLQYTVSSLIESSKWPEMSVPNNPQVDVFLQKVVNCSSDAVNVMAWKSQRSMQMSFNFEDIEEGSPLLRTKRIMDLDIEQEKQKRALQTNYPKNGNGESKMLPILQSQLDQLLSLMSNVVSDACTNIESILMSSALELMRSTIKMTFPHLKVTMDTMTNAEAEGLIKSLKKCSTFSRKNVKTVPEPVKTNTMAIPAGYYYPHFQAPRTLQSNNQQNSQSQQSNQMNYWDKIPAYSLYPPIQTLPQPSPVPPPPLLQPQQENFNGNNDHGNNAPQNPPSNYNYNNGYGYRTYTSGSSLINNMPNHEMGRRASMSFQHPPDTSQQHFRYPRNPFVTFNFPIIPETKKSSHYKDNYNYNFQY